MLSLTGRVADGWLPSQSFRPPETLADGQARIDEAAAAAGRDPAAVRRLYNVTPSDDPAWPAWPAQLTVEHGISTFILPSDNPDIIRRFGEEVAPAVRELVHAERSFRARGGPGAGSGLGLVLVPSPARGQGPGPSRPAPEHPRPPPPRPPLLSSSSRRSRCRCPWHWRTSSRCSHGPTTS
ncbi:LLM class flavin-dependent oxidoreductase [Streptomyces sp. NPDC127197]|uniref:LLM class flavin-dependent oxidoreductase n=1 Tax=Streptomyces sp. NPDC127197 TaxID=3345388 RepID=UPI003629D038